MERSGAGSSGVRTRVQHLFPRTPIAASDPAPPIGHLGLFAPLSVAPSVRRRRLARSAHDALIWAVVAMTIAVTAVWMTVAGLSLEFASAAIPVAACAGCEGLAMFYRRWRPDPRLVVALTSIAQMIALAAAAGCLSYAVAATSLAARDGTLAGWDTALGLDWRGYLAAIDAWPRLAAALALAYASLQPQMILVPLVLGFSGRVAALRGFVLAFALAALVTVLASGAMPAVEMWVHLGLDPAAYPNIAPTQSGARAALLEALRDGTLRTVALDRIEGIITFPSFHAAMAVLLAAALWPVRLLRWPALALNAAMLAATPVYGGHYFADVMAGCAVATLALAASRAAVRLHVDAPAAAR